MKKVKLKFYGLGYKGLYQADVLIYDDCGNLIYKGKTYNNEIILKLKCKKVYKLIAISCGDIIKVLFYVKTNCQYFFSFKRAQINLDNYTSITFLLTDYYYNNLPIERGEIVLWQR